ncbi:MAG: hypothetical protein DRI86_04625 [Bacteroidetes bacterium]|nr:MAG: hypothetical protein DRI86_04625 [Bacteroidota bacterium]
MNKSTKFRHIATLIVFIMTIGISNILYSQTSYYQNDHFIQESGNEGISFYGCDQNSATYNIYKSKEYWIPTANTVEKIIPINIHIFQKSDGTNNWQNNSTDISLINWFISKASNIYENNITPSDPVSGVNEVTSAKIKLVVNAIYFYQNDNLNSSTNVSSMNTFINNNSPNNLKGGFNYYLTEGYYMGAAGFSNGFYICTLKSYSHYVANNASKWGFPKHIAHEFGHVLNIRHTYNQGSGGGQSICDPTNINYLSDIYTSTNPCPHDAGWTCDCNSSSNTCTNNIMGGTSGSGYYSPMQAGIMNRTLSMDLASMFVHEDTYSAIPKEITTNETWDFSIRLYQDLIIKSGNTLIIKCNVYMPPLAKIIVEPNAKLIIDGGKITNPMNSEKYWQGIEVWGDKTKRQLESNQGVVEVINGGTIENAKFAISAIRRKSNGNFDWDKTGGIVKLDDANLINNRMGVWLGAYHNFVMLGSNKREIRNVSSIKNSHFEVNNNMFSGQNFETFIALWDLGHFSIRGNSFKNLKTGQTTTQKGAGIIAYSATINLGDYCPSTASGDISLSQSQALSITPCTGAVRNHFEGLYYGVRAINVTGLANNIVSIDRAEFDNVYHGVFVKNAKYAVITRSDFNISSTDPGAGSSSNLYDAYGIYLDGSDAYKVEENHFNKKASQQGIRGIVINQSGNNDNEIYHNYLSNMGYAIQAQGDNRGPNEEGLGIYCNVMSNGYADIVVQDDGIAENQKLSIFSGNNGPQFFPAGDIFTSCNDNSALNYNNISSGNIIYYADYNNIPNCTYGISIPLFLSGSYRSCPVKLGMPLVAVLSSKSSAKLALNSAKTILTIWKDGGKADLKEKVETTQPWDVYVEFNKLVAESPYLSDEVLLATIENSAFTSLMIKLLMVANTHASHNDEIMNAIYNRVPEMPRAYILEIEAGKSSVSQLELLEANVAACQHSYNKFSNDAKRLYNMDYEDGGDINNYINFVAGLNTLESKYELATLYLQNDDYENMASTLYAISSNFELNEQQNIDLANWKSYFSIVKAAKAKGIQQGMLTDNQITQLQLITKQSDSKVSSVAQSLLMLDNPSYNYVEVVKPVRLNNARLSSPISEVVKDGDKVLNIYPNPSKDYITVEYRTGDTYQNLSIIIKDAIGKTVIKKSLKGGDNEEMINLSELKSGIYSLMLYGDESLIEYKKITVVK